MRRAFITVLAFFLFTFNISRANFFKSEEIDVPSGKNAEQAQPEQSQDQEEFYQLDDEELKQMGYETSSIKKEDNTESEDQNINSVSLEADSTGVIPPSSDKTFILGVEKTEEYSPVQADNMIWDSSKNFLNSYYQDAKNQAPMPILLNAAYVSNKVGSTTRAYIGQSSLGSLNKSSVDFIKANETNYNNGAKVENNGKYLNLSAGVYDSTLNHNLSGGMAIATKPVNIPNIKGSFVFGGGYFANEFDTDNKKTGGLFSEYRLNRFKINMSAAKSKYANSDNLETSLYFTPEFQLTDSISVKTRFIKNVAQNTNQNEIGLTYKPTKNNKRDLELEVNAANYYVDSEMAKQRFRFSAKFKI